MEAEAYLEPSPWQWLTECIKTQNTGLPIQSKAVYFILLVPSSSTNQYLHAKSFLLLCKGRKYLGLSWCSPFLTKWTFLNLSISLTFPEDEYHEANQDYAFSAWEETMHEMTFPHYFSKDFLCFKFQKVCDRAVFLKDNVII